MDLKNVEKLFRERYTRIYKRDVGKGPEQIVVGIVKNYIVVEYKGIFTKLEKNLLVTESGRDVVRNLRKNLKTHVQDYTIASAENFFSCRVIDLISKLSIENESLYLLFVLDKNIEDMINKNVDSGLEEH